jgi:predicted AlkP superfamily phosphohydrolase/phosphomutase
MPEVVSLGLDGAAWHELDRLMAAGELPNFARLVEEGARAPLRSVSPPVTCPAWRCSTAGKNPGNVGVFWWLTLDREMGEFTTPDAATFDTADVWDYLCDEGYRCAIVNVPMTYPPRKIDGLIVSGFGAPIDGIETGAESITYPDELHERLIDRYGWQVGVEDVTDVNGPERAYDLIKSRFDFLSDLLDEGFNYLQLTIFYINVLQHKYGNGPETVEAWRLIDNRLGELLDEDTLLIIYSDHGHSTVERTFSVNEWLRRKGYLSIKDEAADAVLANVYEGLKRAGVSPRRVADFAETTLPTRVYKSLMSSGYPVSTAELTERFDWTDSTAVAVSQGPVYLNREVLGADYHQVRERLQRELKAVTHEGDPVLSDIRLAEDVYDGKYVRDGPDLVLEPAEGWELYGGLTPDVVETEVTSWTSGNHPVGVLAMTGPGVADVELSQRSILDIAPTILQYMGCALPSDMDGEVIDAAFETDLGPRETCQPLETTSTSVGEDERDLESHLSDLGYLE